MTAAFTLAHNYTGTRYAGVDEIVGFIRAYAERNIIVHPVKKYFEEGDHNKLRITMMRDYQCIPFLGSNVSSDRKKQEVKTILNLVARRFFSKWSWDEGGYYHESAAMRELRDKYEQRLETKTVFLRDDDDDEKKGEALTSTKKGDRTVERSLAEDDIKDEQLSKTSFEMALAQCDGKVTGVAANVFVASRDMNEEPMEVRKKAEHESVCKSTYNQKRLSAVDAAKAVKEKMNLRLKKLEAKKDDRIEDLEAQIEALNNQ